MAYLVDKCRDALLLIDVPDRVVLERIQARRLCATCHLDYNLMFHRPAHEGVCDVCQGPLSMRADDHESAVQARLTDYHEKTQPIIELFRQKTSVVVADGTPTPQAVHEDLRRQLGLVV